MAKTSTIEISLTDFVDFVSKSGTSKLTKVKQVKNRGDYSPATDFYKALREGIIDVHSKNLGKAELDKILGRITDPKKIKSYTDCVDAYKKHWGKKTLGWFEPPFKHWQEGSLRVRINPELGIDTGSELIVIKLYFKAEKLSKAKVDQVLTLMEKELRSEVGGEESDVLFGLLDIQASKLYLNKGRSINLLPLLVGEARSFETIYKAV